MGWEIIGPGLLPDDVKVRCTGCGGERMIRKKTKLDVRGCRSCWAKKVALDRRVRGGRRGGVPGGVVRRLTLVTTCDSERAGPRTIKCGRHGRERWRGHIVCEGCDIHYQTHDEHAPSYAPEVCACGLRLMPSTEDPREPFSARPVCPSCTLA